MSITHVSEDRSSALPSRPAVAARRTVHLTSRGRALLLVGLLCLLLAAFNLGRSESSAATPVAALGAARGSAHVQQTVVQPGDTLWQVARRVAPGHDPREMVLRIQDLNDLGGTQLRPGQLLLLPAAA